MQLVNEFVVSRPIDAAWALLTDVERVAPCMPGAQLTEVDGDVYRGQVRVKVGPMLAKFSGQARFTELDETTHRAVLVAKGKESTGKGQASAIVTAQLNPDGEATRVQVQTDLTISGRLAQFGQGALAEISTRLLGQFVDCLEHEVLAEKPSTPEVSTPDTEAAPVNLVQAAGVPILKRLVPVVGGALLLLLLVLALLRRHRT
jgi:hypothetical protein